MLKLKIKSDSVVKFKPCSFLRVIELVAETYTSATYIAEFPSYKLNTTSSTAIKAMSKSIPKCIHVRSSDVEFTIKRSSIVITRGDTTAMQLIRKIQEYVTIDIDENECPIVKSITNTMRASISILSGLTTDCIRIESNDCIQFVTYKEFDETKCIDAEFIGIRGIYNGETVTICYDSLYCYVTAKTYDTVTKFIEELSAGGSI